VRKEEDKNLLERGFTLVELLIVVVILGILAGIVVFAVGNLTDNAASNACKTEGETFATAVQAYRAQNDGNLPAGADVAAVATTLEGADLLNSDNLKYGGVNPGWSYTVASGKVDTANCPA
jgi:prepilin-type N-terminal cleavage/methylation domain-containing protein